jgi:hypothetical protein
MRRRDKIGKRDDERAIEVGWVGEGMAEEVMGRVRSSNLVVVT